MMTTFYNDNVDDRGDENLSFAMVNRRTAPLCSTSANSVAESDCASSSCASHISSKTSPLVPKAMTKNQKSKKSQSEKPLKKMKRGVSFQESQNQVYENQHFYKEDLKPLWYNAQDYAAFKESTTQCAMEVVAASVLSNQNQCDSPRPESPSLSSSLGCSSSSYPQTLQRVYEACVQCQSETQASVLTLSEDVHLKHCLAKAPSRWGVERAAVRWIAADRHYRRSAMLELVLEMQQTMALAIGSSSSSSCGSIGSDATFMDDGLDEILRSSCEALSRPSRLFARRLAQAAAE
jgi:hypothetical protein